MLVTTLSAQLKPSSTENEIHYYLHDLSRDLAPAYFSCLIIFCGSSHPGLLAESTVVKSLCSLAASVTHLLCDHEKVS